MKEKEVINVKKCRVIVTVILLALVLAGCGEKSSEAGRDYSYKQIQMEEAVSLMEEETDYVIVDVRTPEEYAERHIPNARNIPNETIGETEIPELPDKDQMLLIYCRSGNRSKQAAKKLAKLGYTNVIEFGGINDWPGETVSEYE